MIQFLHQHNLSQRFSLKYFQQVSLHLYTIPELFIQFSVKNNICPASDDLITWEQLNNEQFCKIEQSSSFSNQQKLLEYITDLQFNIDCNDKRNKYIVINMDIFRIMGLGAALGSISKYFVVSLQLNRTLLIRGQYIWAELASDYCNDTIGMECYFLPLSNCNADDILSTVNTSDITQYHQGSPNDCIFGSYNRKKQNLTHCVSRVIDIKEGKINPAIFRFINQWSNRMFGLHHNELIAVLKAFMTRPQLYVRNIVYRKISKSIQKSLNGDVNKLNASQTVSLPIRASDKCKNINNITHQSYYTTPEIECFTPNEYLDLLNTIQLYADNTIDTVILTSEDQLFLKQMIDTIQNNENSNVKHWNIITNTEDYSVGEGTISFEKTARKSNLTINENMWTSLYTDPIISALSSLMLQIHLDSEYLVYGDSSSWTTLMWEWSGSLNCNIHPERHVFRGNKCIKLSTPGYIHSKMKRKHIYFSEDIGSKIVDSDNNGTHRGFCDRFSFQ